MGKDVFANGMEIAAAASDCKVIAAFPDVCLTPPAPPAGPVPVPYPNTSFARDMQNGSKSVQIGGKPVMLKDKSFYATSPLGDEAATRSFGAGVISHQITGKTYFAAWSLDVKFESHNVPRHLDLTMSNAGSPGNQMVSPTLGKPTPPENTSEKKCKCCEGEPHSEAQKQDKPVSEEQFYGLVPFQCPNGVDIPPLNKGRQNFVRLAKKECPSIFPDPAGDCGSYYVVTAPEKRQIDEQWRGPRGKAARGAIGAASGEQVNHRVPRGGGGCPVGTGNLTKSSDLSPHCQQRDKTLSTYQSDRYTALSACSS